ncbi:MAG: pyruvoyl-dependent arginine decarboxylase [Bacteroidota bacterium]|nr:pyruvoyl-dependent arginine decarboxylase [Bacteroidota bacterium]
MINYSDLLHEGIHDAAARNQQGLVIGNRIPKDYFITKGTGESDIAVHAGSYHLALRAAGIEMANIMTYSSILPPIANEIPKPEKISHGEVMESIMSVATGHESERLSAGIIFAWLYDHDKKYGGLVCENFGNFPLDELEWRLRESLKELYHAGYQHMELKDTQLITESFVPQKRFGSVIVSLCFTNYFYPVISQGKK